MFQIGTFYKCFEFSSYKEFEHPLRDHCIKRKIKGTIILSSEGINATVSSNKDQSLKELNIFLNNLIGNIEFRFSYSSISPFKRLKIKKRNELVPSGTNAKSYENKGEYLDSTEWIKFIKDPNNIVIDVRNDFENKVGTFDNAMSPNTKNFKEFKTFIEKQGKNLQNKKIGIFCTGGIRCEKAIYSLNKEGLNEIYQLKGGILNFLDNSEDKSCWKGECFVFDERVTLTKDLKPGKYQQCYACRRPLSKSDLERSEYKKGISCHYCISEKSESDRMRYAERQNQIDMKKL